mgnify:CR=1 FL=1
MKYSKGMIVRICDSIKKLKGRVGSCESVGISYETFTQWMKKTEFSEAIKKAEQEAGARGKHVAIQSIFVAMPKFWQSAAWWLERKYKKEFCAPQRHDISGDIRENINITIKSSQRDANNSKKD